MSLCSPEIPHGLAEDRTRATPVGSRRLTAWITLRCRRFNPLTPNDHYSGRTAPLTSIRCILYIYSTNIGTEYFKHGIYSSFFLSSKCSLFHISNVFGSCIIHILYTGCAKIKKNNNYGAKRLKLQFVPARQHCVAVTSPTVRCLLYGWQETRKYRVFSCSACRVGPATGL